MGRAGQGTPFLLMLTIVDECMVIVVMFSVDICANWFSFDICATLQNTTGGVFFSPELTARG